MRLVFYGWVGSGLSFGFSLFGRRGGFTPGWLWFFFVFLLTWPSGRLGAPNTKRGPNWNMRNRQQKQLERAKPPTEPIGPDGLGIYSAPYSTGSLTRIR